MKKAVRYLITALVGVLIFGTVLIAFRAGVNSREPIQCKGLNVVILDSLENDFVSRADVKKFLDKEYGQYIGIPIDSINLSRIEDIIDGRSAVMKSEAYVTKDGLLNIKVRQRKPIVRFQKEGGGFYADAEGYVFPLQSSYASYVQIVDGDIPINMRNACIEIEDKRFNGINVNDYEIDVGREDIIWRENYKQFRTKDMLEAALYMKDTFENIRNRIKKNKVVIKDIYGINGKIERFS